jgi:hypothetical protein
MGTPDDGRLRSSRDSSREPFYGLPERLGRSRAAMTVLP